MNTPQFITDIQGNKLSVVLPMEDYKKMIEDIEELEDIRLYDEATADNEKSLPIDEAFKLIELKRK